MKRFYKNTLISRVSNSALRVVALLCVLLGVSSTAWADTGFHKKNDNDKVFSFKFEHSGTWYNYETTGQGEVNLGSFEYGQGPKLQEFYYRTYKTEGDNVCLGKVYAKINENLEEIGIVDQNVDNYGDNGDNNNKYYYQEWKKWETKDVLPKTIGNHTFYLQIKVPVGNSCNGEIYTQEYKFTYTIKDPGVYLGGNASNGANGKYEPLEYYSTNVYRYKLKGSNEWFRLSDKDSENVSFTNKIKHNDADDTGAKLVLKTDANGPYELEAQILSDHREQGYSEPIYFYYNKSTKACWVVASQKSAYRIEFEDGTQLSCTDLNKGDVCTHSIDLGEGTYRFKVYKNNVAYYFKANGSIITDQLGVSALTQGDNYTTFNLSKYSTCTFTLQEVGSEFRITVNSTRLEEPVLIAANAVLSTDQKAATLSAYLQGSLCTNQNITEYGFVLCSGGKGCVPTLSSRKLQSGSRDAITRGDSYSYTASIQDDYLIGGVTYGYRAFVTIAGKTYLSRETGYFTLQDDCTQQEAGNPNNPVVFTIDASLGADYENDCKLTYGSLQTAIDKLQNSYENDVIYQYVEHTTEEGHNSYNLRQPVIFNVRYYDDSPDDQSKAFCYQGNKKAEVSGGGSDSEHSLALIFKDFNRSSNTYTLTVQGASGANRPWLHHVILRNSRNVVLDNLAIFSDPSGKKQDDALEFDVNTMSWNTIKVGDCANANIVVKNCMIGSNGFTGLHASGYDGITFENNEFEAIMAKVGETGNAVAWGASAKFMFCKNIKFIRNNFRGAHATLVWFQDSNNALFMNNVFWNTNQYNDNCAAVRLVNQYAKSDTYGNRQVENVAFLYNTFYLEDNINAQAYDFLHTSTKDNDSDVYKNITFKYNNCYSYDENVPGKNVAPNLIDSDVCPNNYWSVKQGADFSFGDCQDMAVVSMEGLICETSATGPASLKLKVGDGSLNSGPKLTASDNFFNTNIKMTEEELAYDRYNAAIRPAEGGWTLGAYQAQEGVEIKKIYWIGISEVWDDRNNWGYYPEDVVTTSKTQAQGSNARSADLQRLSCVNTLSDNLTVVIPEQPLVHTTGGRKWPQLPASFSPDVRKAKIPVAEQVSAGTTNYFAHTIELQYGAALKGVESLQNGEEHYNTAKTSVEIPRSQWVLVGTVVQPVVNGLRSNLKSEHYYLNRLPEVYMHYVEEIDADGNATWSSTFTSLEEELEAHKVYAINIPDEYGAVKLPANRYYKHRDPSMVGDGKISKSFNFDGKFVNDHAMPSYTLTVGSYTHLSNTYPCNLSATEIEKTGGQVLYYDYGQDGNGSFKSFDAGSGDIQIKPQQGFLYKHPSNKKLDITADMLADGNTRSRSVVTPLPVATINLDNANTTKGSSTIIIRYDEQLTPGVQAPSDAEKVFAPNEDTPELYMIAYDKKLIRMNVASATQTIPLGVRLRKAMNVRFEKEYFRGFDKVILIDGLRGFEHDLAEAPFTTEILDAGDIEGRYFLNLVPTEEDYESDDNTFTSVTEETESGSINIYMVEDNMVRIITNNVELQSVLVSDLLGKTVEYKAMGNFKDIVLPSVQGVYVIQVIGDKLSRTEKVIVK